MEEAVQLHRGDFLAGFSLRDSPDFDAWQIEQAEGLRRELAGALERLSRARRWGEAMAHMAYADALQFTHSEAECILHYGEALAIFEGLGDRWSMAMCTNALSKFYTWAGEYQKAQEMALRSLAIARELGKHWLVVDIEFSLGCIATSLGDYPAAREHFLTSLPLVSELGWRSYRGAHLESLGYIGLLLGDNQAAERYYLRSLEIYRQVSEPEGTVMALANLDDVARARGNYTLAREHYLEALEVARPLQGQENWRLAVVLKKTGFLFLDMEEFPPARDYLLQALRVAREIGSVPEMLDILAGFAELQAAEGDLEGAAQRLGLILAHPAAPHELQARAAARLAGLAARLPEETLLAAQARGEQEELNRWSQG